MNRATAKLSILALLAAAFSLFLCSGCGKAGDEQPIRELRIFHASGLSPMLEQMRADCLKELNIRLLTEASGSQVACRKLAELGRDCDLIMLADRGLITSLLGETCSWRLDFANDEVVLAVGVRAPKVDPAENDWVTVLMNEDVRIGRVDENQGPIGYRTLLVWKLQEMRGSTGLYNRLLKKCDKVVDHVTRLTPLLKNGDIDYAFVYQSICVARDLRFIALDKTINLGSNEIDYSRAEANFTKLKAGEQQTITVRGAPITWTLSIPDRNADHALAVEFVRYLLSANSEMLEQNGFRAITRPSFYGSTAAFAPFHGFAEHIGELK